MQVSYPKSCLEFQNSLVYSCNRPCISLQNLMYNIHMPLSRILIAIIYVWFGLLKVITQSPANPLVEKLLDRTLPFIPFSIFIICFGLFETLLGILFLIPRYNKITAVLFTVHIFTTFLPLIFLPRITWEGIFLPTLEGQYIIKNIALIALAVHILRKPRD